MFQIVWDVVTQKVRQAKSGSLFAGKFGDPEADPNQNVSIA